MARPKWLILILVLAPLSAAQANTIVDFDIGAYNVEIGTVRVELYDSNAPQTCANCLKYVDAGVYQNTILQRDVSNFVLQGGGFGWIGNGSFQPLPSYGPIPNEAGISNTAGTLAMAKLSGDPNSASNEWFFNLADNSSNLDSQNGGFTVFGKVIDSNVDLGLLKEIDSYVNQNWASVGLTNPMDVSSYFDGNWSGALTTVPVYYDTNGSSSYDSSDSPYFFQVTISREAPEPATMTVLALSSWALLIRRRNRRAQSALI